MDLTELNRRMHGALSVLKGGTRGAAHWPGLGQSPRAHPCVDATG